MIFMYPSTTRVRSEASTKGTVEDKVYISSPSQKYQYIIAMSLILGKLGFECFVNSNCGKVKVCIFERRGISVDVVCQKKV